MERMRVCVVLVGVDVVVSAAAGNEFGSETCINERQRGAAGPRGREAGDEVRAGKRAISAIARRGTKKSPKNEQHEASIRRAQSARLQRQHKPILARHTAIIASVTRCSTRTAHAT